MTTNETIVKQPCRLCGAPTVASIADGFCVDCIEDDAVIFRDGDWVATPAARIRRARAVAEAVGARVVLALPRGVRDDGGCTRRRSPRAGGREDDDGADFGRARVGSARSRPGALGQIAADEHAPKRQL